MNAQERHLIKEALRKTAKGKRMKQQERRDTLKGIVTLNKLKPEQNWKPRGEPTKIGDLINVRPHNGFGAVES